MKKLFVKIFSVDLAIIFFFFAFMFYSGCSCKPCSEQEESKIPLSILKIADQFIASKTGEDFFKKYITVDFSQSKHIAPNYLMVYRFFMPEKPFVDELIRFNVDSIGNVLTQYEVVGIPDCSGDPMHCDFVVDEKIAKQIAVENGLPKGIKDWKVDFIWEAKYNKYIWRILSTSKETNLQDHNIAEGELIIIDPSNAMVIEKESWRVN
ncbi:MAG TPA: hypothetical protein VF870_00025 [Ignavibacteriaceae bacterium]